jgi:pyruvate dehydrogenase E2 component (dihydrolipoamide acetyltransferase)
MPVDVTMPKLSDTMEEGKILRWMKKPGDPVAIGEIIAEVETDKANMELEAYDEGVLAEVRVAEGQSAPVGAVIAVLSDKKAPATKEKAAPAAAKPAAEKAAAKPADDRRPAAPKPEPREAWRPTVVKRPEPPDARGEERVKASPLARKIAEEHGVDLRAISGTGPGGRIVEKDVEQAIQGGAEAPAPERAKPAAAGRVELSRIRRTTAKRMGEAKREIPHFYASAEIAMDEAVRLKEALAALGGEYDDLTYTHVLVKAVGLALRRVPELNASYDGDAMLLHDQVNVGVATAVDDGLVVPVVRGPDREPLAAIVRQARGLLERARAGRFASDDLSGGTFTLSNLGMLPVTDFAAVINPPQAAILAVGAIREVPVVRAGRVVPGRTMTVTVSCDHRIIDGVLAGRFLRELKGLLENPLALVL